MMLMSGHSKWANIKARKAAVDSKRSAVFTRCAKEIMVAIREGGGETNPENNSYLRAAIERARQVNMPKENINRLLAKYERRGANLEVFWLEAYGPFGVPLMIEAESDNRNRLLGQVKSVLRDFSGSLGETGSVSFRFDRLGEIEVDRQLTQEEQLDLIDAGVEEIVGDRLLISRLEDCEKVRKRAESLGLKIERLDKIFRAKSPIIVDEKQKGRIREMITKLKENEEIVNVFAGVNE